MLYIGKKVDSFENFRMYVQCCSSLYVTLFGSTSPKIVEFFQNYWNQPGFSTNTDVFHSIESKSTN